MDIYWLGEDKFRIKGKQATILVDSNGFSIEENSFRGPGEYESKGVEVSGIAGEEGTTYQVSTDGLKVVHLNATKLAEPPQTDILLTPVGTVSDLEPKIIIPFGSALNLPKLIKELGGEGVSVQPKLTISKDKLPEEPVVIVLSQS